MRVSQVNICDASVVFLIETKNQMLRRLFLPSSGYKDLLPWLIIQILMI